MGSPLHTAWELARAWPDAELIVVSDAGHLGSDTTRAQVLRALDRFARGGLSPSMRPGEPAHGA